MDTSAVIAVLLANILVWGGMIGFVIYLKRRDRSEDGKLEPMTAVTVEGVAVERTPLIMGIPGRRSSIHFTDYCLTLPDSFRELGLIDVGGMSLRGERLGPRVEIQTVGAPSTGDLEFDGEFQLTKAPTPAVAELLSDAQVRGAILDLRRSFLSVWIDAGTIRALDKDDDSDPQVSAETLVALTSLLTSAG